MRDTGMMLEHKQAIKSEGSLGAHWPPQFDRRNRRVKGFADFLIDSKADLSHFMRTVGQAHDPLSTRTTVRAFVSSPMLEDIQIPLQVNGSGTLSVEARIPADNVFVGCQLVYFASNSISRIQDPDILSQELEAVGRINAIRSADHNEIFSRLHGNGFGIRVLREATERHINTLQALYREAYTDYTFELSPETIHQMISDPENTFIVAQDGCGAIASAMVAEHATVAVNGVDVRLFELSDYATFHSQRGKGLMTAMQVFAADHLRRQHDGAVIFAEDRAAWTPVGISSRKAGMVYGGTLMQHCRLVSDRDIEARGNLEDLNVFYVPPFSGRTTVEMPQPMIQI